MQRLNVKNLAYDTMNFAKHHEKMTVTKTSAFVSVNSQLKSYNFNIITPISPLNEVLKEKLIKEISIFNQRGLPFNIWCYEEDHQLRQFLKKQQLTLYPFSYEAMVLPLVNLSRPYKPHQRMNFKQVRTKDELYYFVNILTKIYEELEEKRAIEAYYKTLQDIILTKEKTTQLFVGFVDTIAVTIGSLTFKDDTVGMYHIATHPNYQGRGYATQMIHYLLSIAKKSRAKFCTLQSSKEAINIYRRFGFQSIGHLLVYENELLY